MQDPGDKARPSWALSHRAGRDRLWVTCGLAPGTGRRADVCACPPRRARKGTEATPPILLGTSSLFPGLHQSAVLSRAVAWMGWGQVASWDTAG